MSVKVLALGGKGIARAGRRSVVGGGPFFTSVRALDSGGGGGGS